MTEKRWLGAKHPRQAYEAINFFVGRLLRDQSAGKPVVWLSEDWWERKHRLLAAAWCRRVAHLMPPHTLRILTAAIDIVERYADRERGVTWRQVEQVWALENVEFLAADPDPDRAQVYLHAVRAVGWLIRRTPDGFGLYEVLEEIDEAVRQGEENSRPLYAELADLYRDVLGNPFRPVELDPSWFTSTVVSLARQMYESRDFSSMPILADALQDAGCDHPDVLDHCRGGRPHVRGCWVVDLARPVHP